MAKVVARVQMVDQEAVNIYADLSHDRNPLHVDADYAAKTSFGGTILHGTIPCAVLLDEVAEAGISYPLIAEFKFFAPALVGTKMELAVEETESQVYTCTASSNGQPLVVGSVRKEE